MRGPYVDRYLVPKRGNTARQCEDAIGLTPGLEPGRRAAGPFTAAVCDGASESILAGRWAEQLAVGVVRRSADRPGMAGRADGLAEAIGEAVEGWTGWTADYVAEREAAGRPITWYEQPKLDQGAYSTVLAVELAPTRRGRHVGTGFSRLGGHGDEYAGGGHESDGHPDSRLAEGRAEIGGQSGDHRAAAPESSTWTPPPLTRSPAASAFSDFSVTSTADDLMTVAEAVTEPAQWAWWAAALGDTCLFQVRDERLICAFPLDDVESFGLCPPLVGSRNRDRAKLTEHTVLASGWCRPGDQIFLATDALAAWFLAEYGRGLRPWVLLRDFAGRDEAFAPWVERERDDRRMRDDDVALVHIDFG